MRSLAVCSAKDVVEPNICKSNFQVAAKLTGKVVEIDSTGNLVTDVSTEKLAGAPLDSSLRIVVDEHETFGLSYRAQSTCNDIGCDC